MKLKTVFISLLACSVKIVSCDESLEESLGAESKFSEESEAVGKVLGYTPTSIYEWLRSLGLVAYTGIIPGYYVTFPDNKVQNAYFNSTSDVFPLAYTLTGAALVAYVSGYLLTQIPIIDGLRRSGDDEDLGFGRTYDEFDEADAGFDYDVSEYEYNYPDSFYGAASDQKGSFVRKNKKKGEKTKMSRRTGLRFDEVLARQHKESGIFDTIASAVKSIFSPPVKRQRSETLLGGGFEAMMRRYDGYWRKRRSDAGKPNWELNNPRKQARSEARIQSSEAAGERFVGPKLPQFNKEAGSGFYKDRGANNYFDQRSQ